MSCATNTVHPVQIVTRVMVLLQQATIARCHEAIELNHHVKGQGIVLEVVQIDLAPDRMSHGEESVRNIRIDDTAAIVQDIGEAVNVVKDVLHHETIDAGASQRSAEATMIDQENWLTIEITTNNIGKRFILF